MEEKMTNSQPSSFRLKPVQCLASALFVVAMIFGMASGESKSLPSKATKNLPKEEVLVPSGKTEAAASQRVVSLTFKQMGAWSAIKLRGVSGSQTLAFPIRADEIVVAAKLRLAYDYSPSLIPELSHLKIALNDRIAMIEALPKDKELGNSREIRLDPRMFNDMNFLTFTLIGHYTRQCEDPTHSSLWLTLSDLGRLELTLARIPTTPDLKTLPSPFLDKRETGSLRLPFVFASAPSLGTLRAAGIVSSWFGLQAGARGAQFPVLLNALPEGNAVVFLQAGESVFDIKATSAATVSIQPHPNNSLARLLVITGGTDDELMRAARAVALISPTLSGQQVTVTKETEAAPRQPYDAPAWIPTDRPVRFGELARPEELRVQGYYPDVIRLNYRVSPDLFTWRTPGTPIKLKYRATRLPNQHNSSLNISLNNHFLQALALNEPSKPGNPLEPSSSSTQNVTPNQELLHIAPYALNGRDQLQMAYYFDILKQGDCQDLPPDNLQAAIDAESTIDFSGFPHYTALPNLAYFANIGFPFTRMADLSETAVVLPESPNLDEMGLYLTLLGRMGEATGFPALKHAVVSSLDVDKMASRDLLVIGSAKNQALMNKWADYLPMVKINGERKVREPDAIWRPTYRWEQHDIQTTPLPKSTLNISDVGDLTALMAFESPLQAGRSVVFLYADKPVGLRKISDLLTDTERVASVHGDFAVIDDKSVNHAKVSATYYFGSLPWLSKVSWFFSDQPLLFALLGLLISILLATVAYRPLRRVIDRRFNKTA
ncbi:MAG: cellulose synthase regulator BcsB [Comamonadaceae bacterium CG_4_9_14_0_8_um_filter_57_21]|nr:MAG: cellulose synthase regulator BcsB [Comamonadaceae bacterium CG_4_10_14_0_8_um_filter_57_29]PJC20325.1 MAG: cellulose synthase regulator BcsB [Comamonadaceae bacterium CG_4_9_14_0_8_um_filter_57_21]